ncbi:MAG: hypothetical protein ACE5ER_05755 [Nitrospinaceae bacterium]
MSSSIEALREAVQLEKSALECVRTAITGAAHEQTKQVLEKYVQDKEQKIDTLSWMIMAESGDFTPDTEPIAEATEPKKATGGKCPFSGQLAEMGIDLSKMGDMAKPHE